MTYFSFKCAPVLQNLHQSKGSLTSSQATTVGPSHWAKGKPFLLASSSSSCLVGGDRRGGLRTCTRALQPTHVLGLTSRCVLSPARGFPQVPAVTACVCSYTFYLPARPVRSEKKKGRSFIVHLWCQEVKNTETHSMTLAGFMRTFSEDHISSQHHWF